MSLAKIVTTFMDLYWLSDWDAMRRMVTDDFAWENRPSEDILLSFDQLVEISTAFIEGQSRWSGGAWPGISEGCSIPLRSIESNNQVAQERMDMWCTNGRWTRMPCFGFWTFRDGKISSWNDYFDMKRLDQYSSGELEGEPEQWLPERASRKFWSADLM